MQRRNLSVLAIILVLLSLFYASGPITARAVGSWDFDGSSTSGTIQKPSTTTPLTISVHSTIPEFYCAFTCANFVVQASSTTAFTLTFANGLSGTAYSVGVGATVSATLTVDASSVKPGSYTITVTGNLCSSSDCSSLDPCCTEVLSISITVLPASPPLAISSIVSPSTIHVGQSASDLASFTGGFNPTGTVSYAAFSDLSCTVQVFGDAEPVGTPSFPFSTLVTGTYMWTASYSGDFNNNPVSTGCGAPGETLTVLPPAPFAPPCFFYTFFGSQVTPKICNPSANDFKIDFTQLPGARCFVQFTINGHPAGNAVPCPTVANNIEVSWKFSKTGVPVIKSCTWTLDEKKLSLTKNPCTVPVGANDFHFFAARIVQVFWSVKGKLVQPPIPAPPFANDVEFFF